MINIYTAIGSPLHDHVCDAFLHWGGFTVVYGTEDDPGDRLIEVLTVQWDAAAKAYRWRARWVVGVGIA